MIDQLAYLSGFVLFAAQIVCVVHLIRTGRSLWWILGLLFFPLLGVIAYGLIEVLPELRGGPIRHVPFGSASGLGRESVRQLERAVQVTPTVENRTRLAAALLRQGKTGRAVEIYESCLEEFHGKDRMLWYELAEAYHADGQWDRSLAYLRKLEAEGFRDYRERRELLSALAEESAGSRVEALARLRSLVPRFVGQEANYHYARMLQEDGQEDAARRVIEGMLERRRDHDARYRQREVRWYREARRLLKP